MSSLAITTIVKMMEDLPEDAQRNVVEHVREYISDIREEAMWDETFARTRKQLQASARKARKEIAEGKSEPMDMSKL